MKRILFCFTCCIFILACNDDKTKTASADAEKPAATTDKSSVDLPYTASYSSSWTQDVSDADLKTVLTSYKDWSDGNISGLSKAMGDTVVVDMSTGEHLTKTNAELMENLDHWQGQHELRPD